MNRLIAASLAGFVVLCALPLAAASLQTDPSFAASSSASSVAEPTKKAAKNKALKKKVSGKAKSKGSTVRFERGSEESFAERSARLKRECKGRVNAGACAGYTD